MRLGLEAIIFSTVHSIFPSSIFLALAAIPITVHMQEAKAVATKSVGENLEPLPPLSIGASVSITIPDCK